MFASWQRGALHLPSPLGRFILKQLPLVGLEIQ